MSHASTSPTCQTKVLLVDDEDAFRRQTCSFLESEGYAVKLQSPADQSLELYESSAGLEADMCRAIAVGLFGSYENHVYFHSLDGSWNERMTAVTSGTVDILFRGTGLQNEVGITHDVDMSPVIYFERTVLLSSNTIDHAHSPLLHNANICSLSSSFSENAALDYSQQLELNWTVPVNFLPEPMTFSSYAQAFESLKSNQCYAIAGRLASLKTMMVNKQLDDQYHLVALRITDSIPVVGVIMADQPQWHELVNQSIWTPIKAQAQGKTAKNVPNQFNQHYWSKVKLDNINASLIVQSLGNYAEIYDRHFGRLQIPAGPNNHYLAHPDGRLISPY